MQDLDFEELDKAVNSLMPQSASNTDANQVTVNPAPIQQPVVTPVAANINPIERPTTGRFMDVVHPSSDMRSTLNLPQRPSTVIAPVVVPAAVPRPNPVPNQPVTQQSQSQPVINTPVSNTSNWAGLPNYPANSEVPDSPFLSEAKVEKRPLGAFSDENISNSKPIDDTSVQSISQPKVETTDKLSPVEPVDNKIPEELDASLLKVESDSSTKPSLVDPNINPLSQNPMNDSISQQYALKPNVISAEAGNIYDTSSYNKSVIKKSTKKSGLMWVVWIILLLFIGAGAGAAFYYFVMPNLPGFKLPF
jgi:hypothetical protein